MVEGALGRRDPLMERRPDSAAWAARKRKSIDCDFSALRAMLKWVRVESWEGERVSRRWWKRVGYRSVDR